MKNSLLYFTAVILFYGLSGCYCLKTYSSGVSDFERATVNKDSGLCCGHEGRSVEVNAYYGAPFTEKKEYVDRYSTLSSESTEFSSVGQFGLRIEKHISYLNIPYRVLGVGVDYSQTYFNIEQKYAGNQADTAHSFVQHRTVLSINHMTFIRKKSIGYLTFQGGVNNVRETIRSNSTDFQSQRMFQPATFAYRIGYGLQYYPTGGRWGIALEGGYGGGAYVRAGVFCWVF